MSEDSGIIYTKKEHIDKVIDTFFRLLGDLKSNTDKPSIDVSSVRIPVDNGSGNILHTTKTPSISSSEFLEFISENLDLSIVEGKIIANLPPGPPGPPGAPGAPGSSANISYKEVLDDSARLLLKPDYKGQILKQTRGGSYYISNSVTVGDWRWFSFGSYFPTSSAPWIVGTFYNKYALTTTSSSDIIWEAIEDHTSSATNKPGEALSKWVPFNVENYHWEWDRQVSRQATRVINIANGFLLSDWSGVFDESWKRLPFAGGGDDSEIPIGFRVSGGIILNGGQYRISSPLKTIPLCMLKGKYRFNTDPYIVPNDKFDHIANNYVVYGHTREADGNSHSCFHTSVRNLFIDGKKPDGNKIKRGIRLALSQGSRVSDIEVDRVTDVGFHVVGSSDDWVMERCIIQSLLDHNFVKYGMWFDDIVGGHMENIALSRCSVAGLSFKTVRGLTISGYETENVNLPILFRTKNHPDINGNPSDDNGEPEGVFISGIRARRDNDIPGTTRAIARVRHWFKGDSLRLIGESEATSGNAPYDRVEVQDNNGPIGFYPLNWKQGYDRTDSNFNKVSFDFDLRRMVENYRFHSDNIKMVGTALVAKNSPNLITGNTVPPIPIDLQPGLYLIQILSTNTYSGGNVTVNQTEGGSPVPGMNLYSGSGINRYWHHPGGTMEVKVSGSTGATSIWVYFRPWFL